MWAAALYYAAFSMRETGIAGVWVASSCIERAPEHDSIYKRSFNVNYPKALQ